uniref:GATOR complex protein WDR24 n=1 Tax=Ditylenchus dipsaci TaxID=166011 RepID=A0A915EHG5_9BILA
MKSAPLTFENVKGTAFDSSFDGEYLVVAGQLGLTVVSIGLPSTSWLKVKTNRNVVKQVKFHPNNKLNLFASISGQVVDLYELSRSSLLQKITSFTAHSRRISDFCWSPSDDNLMVCCADQDTISFWDLRETQKPCFELKLIFGASQAKFAPNIHDILLTSHGCDLRLWDLRNMRSTVYPVNQFTATESRINALQWHPHEPNIFATSEICGKIKLWDMTDRNKSVPKVVTDNADIRAWRFMFSPEGDELASISLPSRAEGSSCVNIFSNLALENPQPLNVDDGDIVMDICWQKQVYKSTKYLFTLHKSNKLCRHPVAYELSNEVRDEMATPIAQSAADEERDRLIAEHAEDPNLDDSVVFTNYEDYNMTTTAVDASTGCFSTTPSKNTAAALSADSLPRHTVHSLRGALSNLGATATVSSQSPIASEWYRWITAPNKTGGDLYFELESLGNRKHTTEGLYTTEVNFQRAAIGFSYMHWNSCRKIMFEMRFHRSFIENGLVFVEVIQKDSPLTPDKATLFLTLLQQESDEQAKIVSEQTILSRVFQHLPEIVESMKIFTASMPISTANDPNAVIPVTYTPSPYDHFVPAPRNCGARFNGSGYLVTFGRVNYASFSKIPRIKATVASMNGDNTNTHQQTDFVSSRRKSVQKARRGGEDAENSESIYDFITFPSSSAEIPRVLAAPGGIISKRSGKRHTQKSNTILSSLGRTSGTDFAGMLVRPVNPRSLADYCVLVATPSQINAVGSSSIGRQKPLIASNGESNNRLCSVNSSTSPTLFSSSATSSSNTVIAVPSTHPLPQLCPECSWVYLCD